MLEYKHDETGDALGGVDLLVNSDAVVCRLERLRGKHTMVIPTSHTTRLPRVVQLSWSGEIVRDLFAGRDCQAASEAVGWFEQP